MNKTFLQIQVLNIFTAEVGLTMLHADANVAKGFNIEAI
jgi:hypothetical protein